MNSPEKFHLIDTDFHSLDYEKCDLLIQITPSQVSFTVIDREQNQIKALLDFPMDKETHLQDILTHEQLLGLSYQGVKIALQSFKFIFVPSQAYSENSLKDYNKFIQADPATLHNTTIATQQITNITAFDEELMHLLNEKFPHRRLVSTANPLVEAATKIYTGNGKQLILNFHRYSFEAVVLENGRLMFYNIFSIATADDFNYFLLLLLKELNLNPEEINPVVCGYIEPTFETYQRIQKYFNRITFADSGALVNLPAEFGLTPIHRYFSLIGLSLCE